MSTKFKLFLLYETPEDEHQGFSHYFDYSIIDYRHHYGCDSWLDVT